MEFAIWEHFWQLLLMEPEGPSFDIPRADKLD